MSTSLRCRPSFSARRRERGAALMLVLMVTVVFLILMGSLIDVLAIEWRDATTSEQSNAALTAAYSGVDAMILEIEDFYANSVQGGQVPQNVSATFPDPAGGQPTTAYNATVARTWSGNGLNYYLIISTGTNGDLTGSNKVQRTVRALVREIPFTADAMWTGHEHTNTGGFVFYTSGQNYGGPVYSGGPMHIRYQSPTPASPPPIFSDGVQTTQTPVWFDVTNSNTGQPSNPAEVAAVYGSGPQMSIVQPQTLPGFAQNLVVFSESYYGDAVHNDSTDLATAGSLPVGIYVDKSIPSGGGQPLTSGIFVNADATITATGSSPDGLLTDGTQTFVFTPPPNPIGDSHALVGTVTVTVDFANNQTTVTENGATTVFNGVASGEQSNSSSGNGAIFVNGTATIADSTIHGQYTIAAPDPPTLPGSSAQTIVVEGSIKYAADPYPFGQNPNAANSQDELALWANDIKLNDTTSGNIEVDGLLMTGFLNECSSGPCRDGTFFNKNCGPAACGGGIGDMTLYGSLVQNIRGKFGVVSANLALLGGFLRTDVYDSRLGAVPPPFSPTTNIYSIVAVQNL